jgi:pyruvate dehydrogenase E2 component (dihydrolipoamide acetyltransferase)
VPIQILMPALSPTMTEGSLSKWIKSEGDVVESGDVLCEIETDKATMEVEAVDEGILGKILVPEGTEGVIVNSPIAVLLEEGESSGDISPGVLPATITAAVVSNNIHSLTAQTTEKTPITAQAPSNRLFASPLAKRIASQNGIDLEQVLGSGPYRRIIKTDVEAAIALRTGTAAPVITENLAVPVVSRTTATALVDLTKNDLIFSLMPEFDETPHTNMRKMIAKRLTESARDIPHFNIFIDVDVNKLMVLRKQLNDRDGADYKLSVNDFIVKAVAISLKRNPDCNAAYTDNAILKFNRVDISIAVAIEGGLITPIVKNADGKGLVAISGEVKELATKAREGKLKSEEYQGGTFTISNLGMFGVKSFNSIINPPQSGILSVGVGEQRPVVKDGALAIATVMSLTLAVDHRCIDGAPAAAMMNDLKSILEDPMQLML